MVAFFLTDTAVRLMLVSSSYLWAWAVAEPMTSFFHLPSFELPFIPAASTVLFWCAPQRTDTLPALNKTTHGIICHELSGISCARRDR